MVSVLDMLLLSGFVGKAIGELRLGSVPAADSSLVFRRQQMKNTNGDKCVESVEEHPGIAMDRQRDASAHGDRELLGEFRAAIKDVIGRSKDQAMHPRRFVTEREVAAMIGVDARTIRRMEKLGHIPASIRIGSAKRWLSDVLERWVLEKGKEVLQ